MYDECQLKEYEVKFEFSGPRTPQQSGEAESKFQPFYGKIREILKNAGLEESMRSGVWDEWTRTITFLANITSIKTKENCSSQLLFGVKPKLPTHLKIFGEIGVVTIMKNRGMA